MHTLFHDEIGFVHLLASILALASGSQVLLMKKGTRMHKQIGYLYAFSMLIVCVSAFFIYRLFGGFGVFHVAAIVGFLTLLAGMLPIMLKRPQGKWLRLHYAFMYWSVIGLYAAFISELLTRIPDTPFYGMLGLATMGVMLIANICYVYSLRRWNQKYMPTKKLKHH